MLMIGCDFHPSVQQIAALDTTTGRRWETRLSHDGDQVRQLYRHMPHPVRVGLECSGYSLWFEELLSTPRFHDFPRRSLNWLAK